MGGEWPHGGGAESARARRRRPATRRLWRGAVRRPPAPPRPSLRGLWTDLVILDASGFHVAWSPGDFLEWLDDEPWGPRCWWLRSGRRSRPVRMLAMAIYSLALSFGFGAAGVVAIVHTFGGPRGRSGRPGLGARRPSALTSTLCALAVLALGALLVDDIRAADAAEAASGRQRPAHRVDSRPKRAERGPGLSRVREGRSQAGAAALSPVRPRLPLRLGGRRLPLDGPPRDGHLLRDGSGRRSAGLTGPGVPSSARRAERASPAPASGPASARSAPRSSAAEGGPGSSPTGGPSTPT